MNDISNLNITELKSLWLDQLITIEESQKNITVIRMRIQELNNQSTPQVPQEVK